VPPLAAALVERMESEKNSDALVPLGSALGSLSAKLEGKEAASLAARAAAEILKAIEGSSQKDPDLLVTLVAIAPVMEPGAASATAERAVMDLAQSLNETKPGLNDDWLLRAVLISMLTLWAEPAGAAQALAPLKNIPGRAKQISELDSKEAFQYGICLGSAAARLPRDESGALAESATELLTRGESSLGAAGPERISASESMVRDLVYAVGPRAAKVIVRDWVKTVEVLQERQPARQEVLRRVLAVVQGWEAMLK